MPFEYSTTNPIRKCDQEPLERLLLQDKSHQMISTARFRHQPSFFRVPSSTHIPTEMLTTKMKDFDPFLQSRATLLHLQQQLQVLFHLPVYMRSEERRVGKEEIRGG